jgi:hypothetical protein
MPLIMPPLAVAAAADAAIDLGTKVLDAPVRGVDIADAKDIPPGEVE